MKTPFEVMLEAYANNYQGSISDLMEQEAMAGQAAPVEQANTPEEKRVGMSNGPRPIQFNDVQGQPFNTMKMEKDVAIDMEMYKEGELVKSYQDVQPGVPHIDTAGADTVIERPSFQLGGSMADKLRNSKYYIR